MKNKVTTIIVFFISLSCFSQSITPAVTNVSGGNAKNGYYQFEWSVGEMSLTNEMTSTTNLLVTNGFLQPYLLHPWANNPNDEFTSEEIRVFPNPASSYVEINLLTRIKGKLYLSFFDAVGRKIYSTRSSVDGVDLIKKIPVSHFAAGSYLLRIELNADPYFLSKQGVYKIIKAQ
jgi:hypothetical protein